jgi:hypothetical protein
LANACRPVDVRCDPAKGRHQLLVSHDLAQSWTTVSEAPIGRRLHAAGDDLLWIVGNSYRYDAVGTDGTGPTTVPDVVTVAGSADGGRTWRAWMLDDATTGSVGAHSSDSAGGTTWITHGTRVYTATRIERPTSTPSRPDLGEIYRIIAIGPDHAVVQGAPDPASPTVWFQTTDRGGHWTPITDPCAITSLAGDLGSSLTVAPDGSWWATCLTRFAVSGLPGGPPREVVVSTDEGRSWQRRGALSDPGSGQALAVYPISATTAWRTDVSGDVMRTVDGTSWSAVGDLEPGVVASSFVAVDAETAVYIRESFNSVVPVFVTTRDGGRSWRTHPLPPPPS